MRVGSCKIVKGGACLCRLRNGKVKFRKKSACR